MATYGVFLTSALAQAACDAIWAQLGATSQDILAATGLPVSPPVTTAYAAPFKRLTDGLYIVPIAVGITVSGQGLWTIQTALPSWFPAL